MLPRLVEQRRADRNGALRQAEPRFLDRHGQHLSVVDRHRSLSSWLTETLGHFTGALYWGAKHCAGGQIKSWIRKNLRRYRVGVRMVQGELETFVYSPGRK